MNRRKLGQCASQSTHGGASFLFGHTWQKLNSSNALLEPLRRLSPIQIALSLIRLVSAVRHRRPEPGSRRGILGSSVQSPTAPERSC